MCFLPDDSTGGVVGPDLTNGTAKDGFAQVMRALKTLSDGNRTLLKAADESELLRSMCRIIVDAGYCHAAVGYAKHDARKSIRWLASFGIGMELLESFHFTWDESELGRSATGEAIRTGEPVVGRLLTDPAYAGPVYADLLKTSAEMGLVSVTAFPLRVQGDILGALVIASRESDSFDDQEERLLNELADDLAYGIGNLRTVAQHRAAQATIAHLAYFDTLTGLPNRTLLLERLEIAMNAARQQQHALALLHIEVGRFDEINKGLGYHAADTLLKDLGGRLARIANSDETLARVGEAEFALLLPHASADQAIDVARRVVCALQKPVELLDLMLDPRVGVGIALFPMHATGADTLIRCSIAAMHQTKPVRGGYAMYIGGQEEESTRRLSLMGELHRAISNDELRMYCQPKVDVASRRLCGTEALIRWQHPLRGMISPAEFVPLAEQAGMITPLTNWILEAAFRQCHDWQQAGLTHPLAINLSALDLYDAGLVDRIQSLFSTWGIAPEMVQFELTETALMVDPSDALETLARLKRLGVKLFIDDYGTGHSGLSYLQRLPIDAIKIDQSFVTPMNKNNGSAVIVRSTIELSHNLGLTVVAEGVESEPIWARLAALGCDVAQGYFISMPMAVEEFQNWAHKWTYGSA